MPLQAMQPMLRQLPQLRIVLLKALLRSSIATLLQPKQKVSNCQLPMSKQCNQMLLRLKQWLQMLPMLLHLMLKLLKKHWLLPRQLSILTRRLAQLQLLRLMLTMLLLMQQRRRVMPSLLLAMLQMLLATTRNIQVIRY